MERCTLWSTMTFQKVHIAQVTGARMWYDCFAQQGVPAMTFANSCTNAATRMTKAHGCPSLVAITGRDGPRDKVPKATIAGGRKRASPMAGKAPGGQSTSFWDLGDLILDGRGPGVSTQTKIRPRKNSTTNNYNKKKQHPHNWQCQQVLTVAQWRLPTS
jgi:hypothetical protein